ncbi:adenosine 3'-phospho 5'-phosphosulfate transporter 2-like [Anneissia japonica]|uniref:adenosine 3'-phospho 5'-phosphosulfate transporter 2-like n=1 Tax=Anneissia japonica TaxID=1529436 RepID=UPI001425B789|nr:adenosine 3'-phospho 5'-phosphosulfate transporter 2-like [Anneissia japonica]XP_033105299.1 adenosine 3'-phospho 5'-phosphosulfate transporter 2-like [Anneissia japonica]XP_033105300.1 adenosine 3'-phospho 5'-phosphosulfate transporter 2-like [Anneissia japonica]
MSTYSILYGSSRRSTLGSSSVEHSSDHKFLQAANYLMSDGDPKALDVTSVTYNNEFVVKMPKDTSTPTVADKDKWTFLGLPVYEWPVWLQLIFLIGGVFIFYLFYGYMQELIFQLEGMKSYGWFLTLIQFICYSIFGATDLSLKTDRKRKIPLMTYLLLAFLTVSTMGLSNASLGYLNYPTQVIFKCCKLIPVMIGGVLIQSKRYSIVDVMAMLFMTFGLIFFTLADSQVSPSFNETGVLMISLALCADAVIGNIQEKTMKAYNATNTEVVLYSYAIGSTYIFLGLLLHGSLFEAFIFFYRHPYETFGYAIAFSLTGYIGILFVLSLVRQFGALTAVTVTTCRKAVTMVLSFLFFTKPFTMQYVWSGMLVLLGIFINVYSKNKRAMDPWFTLQIRKCRMLLLRQRESLPKAPELHV